MNTGELLKGLSAAQTSAEARQLVERFVGANAGVGWAAVGGRENNRGTIEVSSNPGRALVERVTNAIDAVLEAEHQRHGGKPACTSPREAAQAWLNVPGDGLSGMTAAERRTLANSVKVRLAHGDDRVHMRVEVTDAGTGLSAEEVPATILSLNESNKVQKPHLAGTYGQGGSATFASSKISLIASRLRGSDQIAFTVVRFEPPPPDAIKGGSYVYLTVNGGVLTTGDCPDLLEPGTRCLHFGYDLTKLTSPLGPNSVYGLLQQVMFDPVLPMWLETEVHTWGRRVIKGSRNALNGAVDEGDDADSAKLSHHMPMFYVSLGEFGRAGIEYWVLNRPEKKNKRPTAAFVDPLKPIVLTLNGQNQHEMTQRVIRKDAELAFLGQRLICHIDCNSLTTSALRSLFTSGREEARRGVVLAMLEEELVRALKSDDELDRLNAEARDQKDRAEDEEASETMRKEVARLLRLQGFEVDTNKGAVAAAAGEEKDSKPNRPQGTRNPPDPIEPKEPPTFIKIVWPEGKPITMYPDQRRYVRVETDANSKYHDPKDPAKSHINVVVMGPGLQPSGSTALTNGRMRVVVTCVADATVGDQGVVQVELRVPGRATLSDSRPLKIVEAPKAKTTRQKVLMPPFKVEPVDGPDDPRWQALGWPDNEATIASSAETEDGILTVYYSTVFPRYAEYHSKLAAKSLSLATSFQSRYEIWLAVHSLILDKERETASEIDDDEQAEAVERNERCRVATLVAMFAAAEVERGQHSTQDAND
jgi:hypothetical protein